MPPKTAKEIMMELIAEQPDDSSYDVLLDELLMLRMIERGLDDHRAGRVVSQEQVKKEFSRV